jgi:hypothetical protein
MRIHPKMFVKGITVRHGHTRVISMEKKDALPEKYYFQNGKIMQVVFSNIVQHFSAEQNAYYERTYGGAPKTCIMNSVK